jgi:hypothetical protein
MGTYTALNCATDPAVVALSYTASLEGTLFFAPLQVLTVSSQGIYFATFPLPDLILTRLVPGEIIPVVFTLGNRQV